ncbi:MAG: hypothetical protein QXR42_06895 [Candidatus Bathyarchaeia archaeon]
MPKQRKFFVFLLIRHIGEVIMKDLVELFEKALNEEFHVAEQKHA